MKYDSYSYERVDSAELRSFDLREECEDAAGPTECYRISLFADRDRQAAEKAEAVRLIEEGRTGIAWGAQAAWADSFGDIAADIGCWLNDPDEWEARN